MISTRRRLVVVGYNIPARLRDVGRMRELCRQRLDAGVVLVVDRVTEADRLWADEVIEASFDEARLAPAVASVVAQLQAQGLEAIGVLPFSDTGVLLGTALAARLGLPGGDVERARAGLDKRCFRALENATPAPAGYVPVASHTVADLEGLRAAVQALGGRAFAKPACEGNSRGCHVIAQPADVDRAWQTLAPYRAGGIIVETLIDALAEFSVDQVAGCCWITAKTTTDDACRAEIQQIVPARLPAADEQALLDAGDHMRRLLSLRHGAYHNEIFLLADARAAAVETNMRPAGMRIWDLAALAFEDFDPYWTWIVWSVTGQAPPRALQRRAYAGIRQVRAPRAGTLRSLPDLPATAAALGLALRDGGWSVAPGQAVSPDVADNAGFVGFVVLCHPDIDGLRADLLRLTTALEQAMQIEAAAPAQAREAELAE